MAKSRLDSRRGERAVPSHSGATSMRPPVLAGEHTYVSRFGSNNNGERTGSSRLWITSLTDRTSSTERRTVYRCNESQV